ncbi:carbohydrate ABC transporter permease [Streptomyces sp. NP160]|uniref:carbohydrate ABC transporter permease n=1 Tax=Streptomyces sp. NP160 TaxID=2586637 RepID=UPI00111B47C3|nr:carbohydrate ABC transporter permease [Streptomyces sp. NP160]TNM68911.1 carbohydrate ABC transporter permease [Streptomyces sp. NP160]
MGTTTAERSTTAAPAPQPAARARKRFRWTTATSYTVLSVLALVYVLPFLVQLANSFKTDAAATADPLGLLPVPPTSSAYVQLFQGLPFGLAATNSVIVALSVTAGRVFFSSLAGYALARLRFRGSSLVMALFLAVIAVPPVVLLIPKFLVLNQLGIYNSYAALIIPLMADAAGVFIMRNFFASIPASVEEAAKLDGAGAFRTFWSVVLPMARPAVITITILSFQASWNELSHFIVATNSPDLITLTKLVAQLASGGQGQSNQYPLKLAAALLMTIPVAVLFFVFQKKIMASAEGAVKE